MAGLASRQCLDVFDKASLVTDKDGFMKKNASNDGVHIDNSSILIAALRQLPQARHNINVCPTD